ncbi:uncharacterized protein [Heterodontus francisci]|uniref:uncharacterized protein n=1 Tax=Heterodontus francisci TaxID=7792 RepID=UPI00355ADADD
MPTMLILLCVSFLTNAVAVGGVSPGRNECPEVNFDGSHPVLLSCSDPSYARATLVQWRWTDSSRKWKERLLIQFMNGNITRHRDRADMELSTKTCIENGNCSLTMRPTQNDTGLYHCVVWTSERITERKIRLVYREASPKSSIIVGIILAVIGVACLIVTVIVIYIYKRTKLIQQNQPGNYVNVPLQPRGSNQNAAELDSAYMTLNLNERSLYSQLQR